MKDFNSNENKPVKVNEPTYNWLKKLQETESWENCFYYISRQGFNNDFSFTYGFTLYKLDYDSLRNIVPKGKSYKKFLLKALINGYELYKPLYKVVDSSGLPLLINYGSKINKSFEQDKYEELPEEHKKFFHLTEQQIKEYDERYWSFAVEVREEDYE